MIVLMTREKKRLDELRSRFPDTLGALLDRLYGAEVTLTLTLTPNPNPNPNPYPLTLTLTLTLTRYTSEHGRAVRELLLSNPSPNPNPNPNQARST